MGKARKTHRKVTSDRENHVTSGKLVFHFVRVSATVRRRSVKAGGSSYLKRGELVKQKIGFRDAVRTRSDSLDTIGQVGHDRTSWTNRIKVILKKNSGTVGHWDSNRKRLCFQSFSLSHSFGTGGTERQICGTLYYKPRGLCYKRPKTAVELLKDIGDAFGFGPLDAFGVFGVGGEDAVTQFVGSQVEPQVHIVGDRTDLLFLVRRDDLADLGLD